MAQLKLPSHDSPQWYILRRLYAGWILAYDKSIDRWTVWERAPNNFHFRSRRVAARSVQCLIRDLELTKLNSLFIAIIEHNNAEG